MMHRETQRLDVGTKHIRSVDVRRNGEWAAVLQDGNYPDHRDLQRRSADAPPPQTRTFWGTVRSLFTRKQPESPAPPAPTNEKVEHVVKMSVFCDGLEFPIPEPIAFPRIRFLGDDRILIVGARSANAWIFSRDGASLAKFEIGDAVQDIWTTHGKIVVTYFDEASGDEWETGVAVFDETGKFEFAFDSIFSFDAVPGDGSIIDAGGSCLTEDGDLWFLPYTSHDDIFVQLDVNERKVTLHPMPEEIGSAPHTITTADGTEFFVQIFAYDNDDRSQRPTGTKIMSFRHGQSPQLVDYADFSPLRSLSNGRFVTWAADSFTIITPASPSTNLSSE